MSDPLNPNQRLLSALDLGPSWARDAVPRPSNRPIRASNLADDKEVKPVRRDERRFRQGDSRDDRGPRQDRRNHEKGRTGGRSHFSPVEAPIAPAAGVKVRIEPNKVALHLIAKEIVHVARVYSLFDVAKTIVSERERYVGVFHVDAKKAPLYYGHRDHSLWLTQDEAVQHFWKAAWRHDLYEEQETEVEGPSGNFQVVAKCGLSGKILGPPNYHAYQATIRQVHRELFPQMPFDRYASKIVTERSEEAVQAWLHTMKTKLRWRPVGQEQAEWLEDRSSVEQHFLQNRFAEMYVTTHEVEVPAHTPVAFFSPSLLVSFKNAARHAASHPTIIIPSLCQLLEKEHLPVFKKQGKLFAGPSRPHPIPDDTSFADRMQQIVDWMRLHPESKLSELWKGVLPDGQNDPTEDWLADLFWLLSQGHLLLFADDTIVLPLRKKAEPNKEPSQPAAEPVTKSKKTRKRNKKRRQSSRLRIIEKRVAALPAVLRKRLQGYERTVSHRLRLKSQYRQSRLNELLDDADSFSEQLELEP